MSFNPNVNRFPPYIDFSQYTEQESEANRVELSPDPSGQRGQVVKISRLFGDPLVNSGYRQELARDVFVSERAFVTGGGFYWTSYMFGPTWAQYISEGLVPNTGGNNAGILIKQFHPRTSDAFIHPIWVVAVNNDGVHLRKWNLDDGDNYEHKATWPIDSMIWHDIVFGLVTGGDSGGKFLCWLDGVLIYREEGAQIYQGASSGPWYSEGIYSPGGDRTGVDILTIYTQGYRQSYPTGANNLYSDVVGEAPASSRRIMNTRTVSETKTFSSERTIKTKTIASTDFGL